MPNELTAVVTEPLVLYLDVLELDTITATVSEVSSLSIDIEELT